MITQAANHALYFAEHYALVGLVALVLFGAGRRCLDRLEFRSVLEEVAFSTGLGLGLFGTVIFLLGLVKLIYFASVLGLLCVMFALSLPAWRKIAGRIRAALREVTLRKALSIRISTLLLLAAGSVLAYSMLIKPLYPPHQWDAISYHLAVARSFAATHTVDALPHLRFCVFPQLMNVLFAAMLLLQDDIAAQLISFLSLVLSSLVILGWGWRRFSFGAGTLGVALLLGSPMIHFLASSAYIDMGLTMFVTLAIIAMFNWAESRDVGWVALAGSLAGFAGAVKYTGAFLAPAFLIVIVMTEGRSRVWRTAGALLVPFLLLAGPWYVRNAAYTSDPFFPMMGRSVENSCWSAEDAEIQAEDLVKHGGDRTFISFMRLPWDLTFDQKRFVQDLHTRTSALIFLLLPLAVWFAAIDGLARRMILAVLAFTIVWFVFAPLMRYLQPIVPLWSLLTGAALERPFRRFRVPRTLWVAISLVLCGVTLWYGRTKETPRYNPLPVSEAQRDLYLFRFPTYVCYEWLNRHAPDGYRVFSFGDEYMAYFAEGIRMGDLVGPGRYSDLDLSSASGLYRSLRRLKADYLMTSDAALLAGLRADPQFSRYFQLVCANANALTWQITSEPDTAQVGPNLILNPGLEELQEGVPETWSMAGSPQMDFSGRRSRSGSVAFRAERQHYLFTSVPVASDQLYEVRLWARAEDQSGEVRFEFHWQDENGQTIGAATQLLDVGDQWTELVFPLSTPEDSSRASFHPHASDAPVWLDDFSLRPIHYVDGVRAAHPEVPAGRPPSRISIRKSAVTDRAELIVITAEDPDGGNDLAWIDLILGDAFSSKGTCTMRWTPDELALLSDDGTESAGRLKPGDDAIIGNSFCEIDGTKFSFEVDATRLLLTLHITPKKGSLTRAYARAQDRTGRVYFWEPVPWTKD